MPQPAPTRPPGPRLPAVLQIRRWVRNPMAFLDECAARYGETFTLRIGRQPTVFTSDPAFVKAMFSTHRDNFAMANNALASAFIGRRSLIEREGEEHRRQRRLVDPFFRGEQLRGYVPAMLEEADRVLDALPDGEPFAVHTAMQEITANVIVRTIFGVHEDGRCERLRQLLTGYMDLMMTPGYMGAAQLFGGERVRDFVDKRVARRMEIDEQSPARWPWHNSVTKVVAAKAELFAELHDEIERARHDRERDDVLARFVHARYDDGGQMDAGEIVDELMLLLLAGHETTATTLTWAIGNIFMRDDGSRASLAQRLRDEVDAHDDPALAAATGELTLTDAIFRETLRFNPVVVHIPRLLKDDFEVDGYLLPAGSMVAACVYRSHRRPDVWDEPQSFNPDRFIGHRPSPFEYYPFGGGHRVCVGNNFAAIEGRLVLARLLERFELQLAPTASLAAETQGFRIQPIGGLPAIVRPRASRKMSVAA